MPPPPAPVPFGVPPAPQFGAYAPPGHTAPGYGSQGYGSQGYGPQGYPLVAGSQSKPPRPEVKAGSLMLIGGGVGLILGSVLDWVTIEGTSINGFSSESLSIDENSPGGGVFVFFAVLLIGFGITQLAARKVLAVAILAVVFASFAVLVALGEMSDVSDVISVMGLIGGDASWGPGIPVLILSSLVGLGGAIATLAKRRRHAA